MADVAPYTLVDPMAAPTYRPTRFQKALESLVYDPRDVAFLRFSLLVVVIMTPLIALLYWRFSWWLAAVVSVVQLPVLAPPVILMLHNTMHRPFIKRPRWLNRVHVYLMSALIGVPTQYMEHHVAMHHVENNLRGDLSSTMRYQRDNVLHWLVYVGRFFFTSHVELTRYLIAKGRAALAYRALAGDAVHVATMALLCAIDWRPTVVAFVAPWVVIKLMMMMGNWGQHAFIDADRPGDSFVNSITCINSPYNARCFNDGYHIGHHVKQNRHWTEMPQDFLDHVDEYRAQGCIVFEKLDFFMVSVLLFTHQYDVLARHVVRWPNDTRSHADIVALLKTRTRRIPDEVPDGVVLNA